MISTQYIKLNMTPSGALPVLYCSQYDVGRPLGLVVHNGSEPVDLDTYTVTIEATRTDGTPITAAVATDDNIGVFVTTPEMTNKEDKYFAKLALFDTNSRRVASLAFVMVITPATMDENAQPIQEDRSLYQQYTGTVQSLIAEIRADIADLQDEKVQKFDTVAQMQADTTLGTGMYARTGGYYAVNDGGGALYKIVASDSKTGKVILANGNTAALVPDGYLVPEQFGAVGNGVSDDTQAIKDLFAYQYGFYKFGRKTYKVGGGIDVSNGCHIIFDATTFNGGGTGTVNNTNYYLLAFKANGIYTDGWFALDAKNYHLIGLLLEASANNLFDGISVSNALLWGLYADNRSTSLIINNLYIYACGMSINFKAKYREDKVLDITDISDLRYSRYNSLSDAVRRMVVESEYNGGLYVIDDSGYDEIVNVPRRVVFRSNRGSGGTSPLILDANDTTKGVFTQTISSGFLTPYDTYVDGVNGRNAIMPLGGGCHFASNFVNINKLYCQISPVVLKFSGTAYSADVNFFGSHVNMIPLIVEKVYAFHITQLYSESAGNGFQYATHKNLIAMTNDEDTVIDVTSGYISGRQAFFMEENSVIMTREYSKQTFAIKQGALRSGRSVQDKLYGRNIDTPLASAGLTINEYTPRKYTALFGDGIRNTNSVTITLADPEAVFGNRWEPFEFYIKNDVSGRSVLRVILHSSLTNYTLNGATNNVLNIDANTYGGTMKVTIMLFGKVFYVTAEAVNFIT